MNNSHYLSLSPEIDQRRPGVLGMALAFLVLILTCLFLVPLSPIMPAAGLDSSWQYAVNEAVARRLVFGRDFIFTFGPFASVYTQMYHPQTDRIMILGSLLTAFSLYCGFLMLLGRRRVLLIFLLPPIITEIGFRDAFLMVIPLLLVLVIFGISPRRESGYPAPIPLQKILGIACLTCGVAVLPLIKGSFAGMAFIEGAIALFIAFRGRRPGLAAAIGFLAIATLCAAWVLTGQPIGALPNFFIAQAPIVSGYSQAMSLHGPFQDVAGWLLAAAVLLASFHFTYARKFTSSGWIATLAFAFYLFVVFKAGFVRQDGHSRIAGDSLLFAGLILLAFLRFRWAIVIAVVVVLDWSAIAINFEPLSLRLAYDRAYEALAGIPAKIAFRERKGNLDAMFEQSNVSLRARYPLPNLSTSADIYPANLSSLFASGTPWSGRPIPQSYSSYTASLSALNAAHLTSPTAPENIFFSISPIDGRLPALEDSQSWPVLLTRYRAVAVHDDFVQFVRREVSAEPPRYGDEYKGVADTNRDIALPRIDGPVWAILDLNPTLIGRIALTIFRLPQVHIEITLDDDSKILDRFIPQMGKAGFLISPYIANANQFLGLAWGPSKQRTVKSMRLTAGGKFLWKSKFDFAFRSVTFAPEPDSKKLVVIESLPSFHLDMPATEGAECAVDYIDGRLLKPASTEIKIDANYFSIQGWAAPAAKQGTGPDKIILSLTDGLGHVRYYAPKIQQRTDVKTYFGHPEMSDPGFEASLDTSELSGRQKLTVYALDHRGVFVCPMLPDLIVQ